MRRSLVATIAVAGAVLAGAPAALGATYYTNGSTGDDANPCSQSNPCKTIQGTIVKAPTGSTISVAAGTYDVTTPVNVTKDLTIQGAGDGTNPASSTIVTVASNSTALATDGAGNNALMYIGSTGSGSTIEDLTIDGNDDGDQSVPPSQLFVGLDIKNANATLTALQITRIEQSPAPGGGQTGIGLNDVDGSGSAQSLTASSLNLNNYQKAGAEFSGGGLTANLSSSTVAGVGPTTKLAQNGVEYLNTAEGTVSGSTITGNECSAAGCGSNAANDTQAFGVLFSGSGPVTASGNTINGNDGGIFWGDPASATADTATIQNNILNGNRYEDLFLTEGVANVSGNTLSGSDIGVQVYTFTSPPPDTSNAVANLTGNSITGNLTGIEAGDDTTSSPPYYPVITAHYNEIDGNSLSGFANDVYVSQNATQNWWGCSGGPNATGCDRVTGIGASLVQVSPWITSLTPLPPGIHAAFGVSTIPVGGTTTLTFTITNPNQGSSLTGLAFTDNLPSGLQVANPNGASGSCGGTFTAPAGGSTISLSGGSLSPASTCTLAVTVKGTSAGQQNDTTTAVTSNEGGTGNTASASITVGSGPTVTIASPAQFATYGFGSTVHANYSCQDSAGGPGISSCTGTVPSGSAIATNTPGVHTFTVTATSQDGLSTTQSVLYLVLPDNHFKVTNVKGHSGGNVTFDIVLPGPGRITVVATAAKPGSRNGARIAYGQGTQALSGGSHSFVLHIDSQGKAARRAHPSGLLIRLFITFQPNGVPANVTGTPSTQSFYGVHVPAAARKPATKKRKG